MRLVFLLDVVDNNMNYQRTRPLFSQRSAEVSFPSRHPPPTPVHLLAVRASLRDDKSARKSLFLQQNLKNMNTNSRHAQSQSKVSSTDSE